MKATYDRMADGTLAAWVHPTPDADVVARLADALRDAGAIMHKRIEGPDELYWDYELEGKMFTLHSQHYLGIALMAYDKAPASEELLRHTTERLLPGKLAFAEWWHSLRQTGEITPVRLGCPRSDLRELWGEPDDESTMGTGSILVYGRVEFHFEPGPDGTLFLIYKDNDEGVVELCIKRGG